MHFVRGALCLAEPGACTLVQASGLRLCAFRFGQNILSNLCALYYVQCTFVRLICASYVL